MFKRGDIVVYQNPDHPDHDSIGSLGIVEAATKDIVEKVNWLLPTGRIVSEHLLDAAYNPDRFQKIGHIE